MRALEYLAARVKDADVLARARKAAYVIYPEAARAFDEMVRRNQPLLTDPGEEAR